MAAPILNVVDDVEDDLPGRMVDLTYPIDREKTLPLGKWYGKVEAARNEYAQAHGLSSRNDKLDWKQTGNSPRD